MKFKPLVDEEEERRRASAAAKLRALDEAIAKRKAEEERYARELCCTVAPEHMWTACSHVILCCI